MSNTRRCVIFGASGKTGQLLVKRIASKGYNVVNVSRKQSSVLGLPGKSYVADLTIPDSFKNLLKKNDLVINIAHARYTEAILENCPTSIHQLIVLGSTRHLTKFPDKAAEEVKNAMAQLKEWNGYWTMLHPTMIYGASGENNIQRMAHLIKKFKFIPLPNMGKSLIQPIHVEDVVSAILLAVSNQKCTKENILIAGPKPLPYKEFIKKIANASGSRCLVLPMNNYFIQILATLTQYLPFLPSVTRSEVERLMEDKNINKQKMTKSLGLAPRELEEGLKELFRFQQ